MQKHRVFYLWVPQGGDSVLDMSNALKFHSSVIQGTYSPKPNPLQYLQCKGCPLNETSKRVCIYRKAWQALMTHHYLSKHKQKTFLNY